MGKKAAMPAADEDEAQKMQTAEEEEEEEEEEKDQEEEQAQEKPKGKPKAKASGKATPKATQKGTPKASASKATPKASPTGTPKATAKATPKATAKATPKAAPKATPKANPKAKAKASPDAPDTEKPKPRPKGKRTMAEALTGEWRNGLAPEEPEQVKEEEEPDLKRWGRSKQNKFNVLLAAGAVPASMRKEWEALKTAGSRKSQSKFIEDMVVRDEKTGRLALSCDKGSLEASVGLKHKSKTGWGDKGLSKTLFKGKFGKFGLTDEMLRQAILDDEVQVKTQDGVAFCQWRELKEERMDERATDAKLCLDAKKVSGQQAAPDGDAL